MVTRRIAVAMFLIFVQVPATAEDAQPLLRCGSNCLYTALLLFEKAPADFESLESSIGMPAEDGYSLAQLQDGAQHAGLNTLCVSTSFDNLHARRESFACIAHINGNHFVLLTGIDSGRVFIVDPPREYSLPESTLRTQWDGAALLLSTAGLESEESVTNRIRRNKLLKRIAILVGALGVCCFAIRLYRNRSHAK